MGICHLSPITAIDDEEANTTILLARQLPTPALMAVIQMNTYEQQFLVKQHQNMTFMDLITRQTYMSWQPLFK